MNEAFQPLEPQARREKKLEYRRFLADRDGRLDLETRTLARREESMTRHMAMGSRALDRATFDAQYARFDPERATSPEMLLLLSLVKINAAEAFGVSKIHDIALRRALRDDDDTELMILMEETYHTRILLSTARVYGWDIAAPYQPPFGFRSLIGAIAYAPELVSRPLILASEILGTISFYQLLRSAGDILRDAPEVRDAVEERITEVLIDEIGHISYNRLCLGGAGLARTRAILPLTVSLAGDTVKEMGALGMGASRLSAAIGTYSTGALPETIRRRAFIC